MFQHFIRDLFILFLHKVSEINLSCNYFSLMSTPTTISRCPNGFSVPHTQSAAFAASTRCRRQIYKPRNKHFILPLNRIAPKMRTLRNMSTLSERKKRALTSGGVTACMRPRLPRLTAGFMTDRAIRVASGLHRRNEQRIEHTHMCLARGTACTQPTHIVGISTSPLSRRDGTLEQPHMQLSRGFMTSISSHAVPSHF